MDIGSAAAQNIVPALGLEALPLEAQRAVIERVGSLIFGAVVQRVAENLSSSDREELGRLFASETASGDEVLAFLEPRVPNLEGIVADEAAKFKAEALGFMGAIAGDPGVA